MLKSKDKKPKKKKSKTPIIVPASGPDSGNGRVSVVVPTGQAKKQPVTDAKTTEMLKTLSLKWR